LVPFSYRVTACLKPLRVCVRSGSGLAVCWRTPAHGSPASGKIYRLPASPIASRPVVRVTQRELLPSRTRLVHRRKP
jgi:hypothetical protein